jgi:hypothetical protein
MFFTFPEDARWNADRQAVEFGGRDRRIGGVVRVPRRVFQRLLPERPHPSGASRRTISNGPGFESIAEGNLPRRQLAEDWSVVHRP